MRQADLRAEETDNLPPNRRVFFVSGLPSSIWTRFPKAEKYTHPGPEGLKQREKK
jgi:hypothetical protein